MLLESSTPFECNNRLVYFCGTGDLELRCPLVGEEDPMLQYNGECSSCLDCTNAHADQELLYLHKQYDYFSCGTLQMETKTGNM